MIYTGRFVFSGMILCSFMLVAGCDGAQTIPSSQMYSPDEANKDWAVIRSKIAPSALKYAVGSEPMVSEAFATTIISIDLLNTADGSRHHGQEIHQVSQIDNQDGIDLIRDETGDVAGPYDINLVTDGGLLELASNFKFEGKINIVSYISDLTVTSSMFPLEVGRTWSYNYRKTIRKVGDDVRSPPDIVGPWLETCHVSNIRHPTTDIKNVIGNPETWVIATINCSLGERKTEMLYSEALGMIISTNSLFDLPDQNAKNRNVETLVGYGALGKSYGKTYEALTAPGNAAALAADEHDRADQAAATAASTNTIAKGLIDLSHIFSSR